MIWGKLQTLFNLLKSLLTVSNLMISSLLIDNYESILLDNEEILDIDYANVSTFLSIWVISVFIFLTVSIEDINLLNIIFIVPVIFKH